MYKYLLSFLTVLFFKTTSLAQVNLVPNGGFEEYTVCPSFPNDLSPDVLEYVGWKSTYNSVDFFSSCSTTTYVSIPSNIYGYQISSSGNCYIGLAGNANISNNLREIATSTLQSAMDVGIKYFLRMKVSPTLGFGANLFVNRIGMLLSTVSSNSVLPNFAHLKSNVVITDTLGWTELFGSIIADSAYQYISIGIFFNDNSIITQTVLASQSSNYYSYFYIDDVCVSVDSVFCKNFAQQSSNAINEVYLKQLRVYPNPIENNLIKFNEKLYNRKVTLVGFKGEIVFRIENYTGDELQLPKELEEGIYNLTIDGFISKRIILLKK